MAGVTLGTLVVAVTSGYHGLTTRTWLTESAFWKVLILAGIVASIVAVGVDLVGVPILEWLGLGTPVEGIKLSALVIQYFVEYVLIGVGVRVIKYISEYLGL